VPELPNKETGNGTSQQSNPHPTKAATHRIDARHQLRRITNIPVHDGEPELTPDTVIEREIKLGGQIGPRPERDQDDFTLKQEVVTLLEKLSQMGSGKVCLIEIKHGLPFLMRGLVQRWPLSGLAPDVLREQFSHVPVRARVGDYINTAFAADRAMQDMSMGQYLDLVAEGKDALPPYLGNLELRELNALCHWPAWFKKMGPPRFWLGPSGTVTPLHCDYDDNIFARSGVASGFSCPRPTTMNSFIRVKRMPFSSVRRSTPKHRISTISRWPARPP